MCHSFALIRASSTAREIGYLADMIKYEIFRLSRESYVFKFNRVFFSISDAQMLMHDVARESAVRSSLQRSNFVVWLPEAAGGSSHRFGGSIADLYSDIPANNQFQILLGPDSIQEFSP